MPQVEISNEDLLEIGSLVYRRWAEECDLLKNVKGEKDDGSEPDYEQMHAIRLKNHTARMEKWRAILYRIRAVSPRLI